MGWIDVQKGMRSVTWASETHRPVALPRLGQAMPAKPRRSASAARPRMAPRFPGTAMSESAGSASGMAGDGNGPGSPLSQAVREYGRAVRIGLVCPYSLTVPGGVQGQVLGLARVLRALGHEARVLEIGRAHV